MTGDTRAAAEPALGEQAIAQAVADEPGPLTTDREDGLDGGGQEDAQAVAQAHVYRILTGRSYFDLERHFDRAEIVAVPGRIGARPGSKFNVLHRPPPFVEASLGYYTAPLLID